MRNQERQELDRGHELVVDAEAGVDPRPLVVDHPVFTVSKPPEAHGGSLHVGEEALEALSVVGGDRDRAAAGPRAPAADLDRSPAAPSAPAIRSSRWAGPRSGSARAKA